MFKQLISFLCLCVMVLLSGCMIPHPLQGVVAYSPGSSGVGSFTITGATSFQ